MSHLNAEATVAAEQRINDALARASAAAQGPWAMEACDDSVAVYSVPERAHRTAVDPYGDTAATITFEFMPNAGTSYTRPSTPEPTPPGQRAQHLADFEFIAHAREDIPWLVEQVRTATTEAKRLRTECHDKAAVLQAALSDYSPARTKILIQQVATFLERLAHE